MQRINIHPLNPQPRLIKQVVEYIHRGEVIVYPTDSGYAMGCHLDDRAAVAKIRLIRHLDKRHNFTLMCRNLSELGTYARADNSAFRFLKANTPGAFTFILNASKEVPRRLAHEKRKTIGIRVPDHIITQAILSELNQPLMSVSLILPELDIFSDVDVIDELLASQRGLLVDSGYCPLEPTTVVDLTTGVPNVRRQGKGSN